MKNNNYTFACAKTYPIELPIYIFYRMVSNKDLQGTNNRKIKGKIIEEAKNKTFNGKEYIFTTIWKNWKKEFNKIIDEALGTLEQLPIETQEQIKYLDKFRRDINNEIIQGTFNEIFKTKFNVVENSIETKIEFLYKLVYEYNSKKIQLDNITNILQKIREEKGINIKLSTARSWLLKNSYSNFNTIINKAKTSEEYNSNDEKYRNFKEQVNYLDKERRYENGKIKKGNFFDVYNIGQISNSYSIETKIEFLYKLVYEYDSKKSQLDNITNILQKIREEKGIDINLNTARSWLLKNSYTNFNTIINKAKTSEEYNSTDEKYNDFKEQVNQLNLIMEKFKHNNENFIKIIKNLNNSLKEIQKYDDNQIQENLHFIINTIKLLPKEKIQKNVDFIKNVTHILCKKLSDDPGRSDFKYYKFIIDISNKTDQNEIKNIFYENLNENEIKKQLYLYDNIYEAKFNLVKEIYSMNKDLNNCKYHQNNIIDSCESILFTEPDKKNIFNRFNFILDSIDIINDKNIKNDILNRLKNKIQSNANEILLYK